MNETKRVIVTGANGFVGYWLIRELTSKGVTVVAVLKDENEKIDMFNEMHGVSFVYCDLSKLASLTDSIQEKGFDAFYHLAWIAAGGNGRSDYSIQLANVKYACDAVHTAVELGCKKILFAGTISERLTTNIFSKDTPSANEIYAVCKDFTHTLTHILSRNFGIDCVWMQFANLFGPYSINGNIVGYTIESLLSDKEATFGPADQIYDLLYIEDLAKAATALGLHDIPSDVYYIGSGNPCKLKDYLIKIGEIMHKQNLVKIGARADDGTRYDQSWFSIEKLKNYTGFTPNTAFEEGIEQTINWLAKTKI